jgi:hypothetical protein
MQEKEDKSFRTFPTSDLFFVAYFWAACLEAEKKPKKFGPENISPLEVETTEATS